MTEAHTQPENFFITFKQTVVNKNGVWKPLYDPAEYGIPNAYFRRHYIQRYYTKGLLRFLIDKLMLKHPQPFRFWVEVTVKNNGKTRDYIKMVRNKPEVEIIATPPAYKF